MRAHARSMPVAFLLLAALLPSPAAPSPAAAHLVLSEILPDPDTGQREFVEVWNNGNATADLTGWKLRDLPTTSGSTNTYTFPAWSLAPNGRVVVWGGGAADAHGPVWSNSAVWNNAGDGASLLDPTGAIIDWLGYGAITPPAGQEGHAVLAKPDKGVALAFEGGQWRTQPPSPGTTSDAVGADLQFSVQNLPPIAQFGVLPRTVRPGTQVAIPLVLADGNGAADIGAWSLSSGTTVLAQGVGIPAQSPLLVAPVGGATWRLHVSVSDKAGALAQANATLALQWSDLRVELRSNAPASLPGARPGGQLELGQAALSNDADHPVRPLIDVSPFVGPGFFDPAGIVSVGITVGNQTTWIPYGGPLTRLPELPAHASATLVLRLDAVPAVAAGDYGTSFTVVPA